MLVDDKQSHNVHFSSAAAVQAALATIEEERKLTFRQAFRMYWRAALWSAGLSAALIMEGYDVGIVSLARLTLLVSSYGHSTEIDSDQFLFRAPRFPRAIRFPNRDRRALHSCQLAVGDQQCSNYRSARRSHLQRMGSGQVWLQAGLHWRYGMDDRRDLHSSLLDQLGHVVRRRGGLRSGEYMALSAAETSTDLLSVLGYLPNLDDRICIRDLPCIDERLPHILCQHVLGNGCVLILGLILGFC